ncbi:MAG: hypothetical protein JO110_05575 [Acetobacteraceae bacterium]|nr:hypothetical protein [Acetobacteraceae bacterium]
MWFVAVVGDLGRSFAGWGKTLALLIALVVIGGGAWIATQSFGGPLEFGRANDETSREFERIMSEQAWAEGESPVESSHHWWVIFRGTVDRSHVSFNGKPEINVCLHLYAKKQERDAVGTRPPHPYLLGFLIWPEVMMDCTFVGKFSGGMMIPHAGHPTHSFSVPESERQRLLRQ